MNRAGPAHTALIRSAAYASIATALMLAGLKLWAVWETRSAAMLGSLGDTALDILASLITLAGVWVASRPPDQNHRFGHGKAEALAAMFQIVLISLSVIAIGYQAIAHFLAGTRPQAAGAGIVVSVVAIVATLLLLGWQSHVVRRTGSLAIATDRIHYQSDLFLNLAVIVALAADQLGDFAGVDAAMGLAIALWLGRGAYVAWRDVAGHLMDKEWPEEERQRLLNVLDGYPGLLGVHDLRTRRSGVQDFVQFHIWLDGATPLGKVHQIMDGLEARIHDAFPNVEILIHPDPDDLPDRTGIDKTELGEGRFAAEKASS